MAFKKISKQSVEVRNQIFEGVINPMKTWATETYPALLKDLTKCDKLKKASLNAEKRKAKNPNDGELQKAAESAKNAYDAHLADCKSQMDEVEKVRFGFLLRNCVIALFCRFYHTTSNFGKPFSTYRLLTFLDYMENFR